MNTIWIALREFYKIGFLRPSGMFHWIKAVKNYGQNLSAILAYQNQIRPSKIAIQEEDNSWTYAELFQNSLSLQTFFIEKKLTKNKKIAIISHNNATMIQVLFTCSSIGNDIVLLNADYSQQQLEKILLQNKFDTIIVDQKWSRIFTNSHCISLQEIESFLQSTSTSASHNISKSRSGNIVVMSGGSSGKVTLAERKPSVTAFLYPLIALLHKIKLHHYNSLFLSIPIYHGFGLASLIVTFVLGKSIYISQHKSPEHILSLLNQYKIDVIALVPTILSKLLQCENTASSLRCMISGGARLPESVIKETNKRYGDILYNLYGTSEAGFCVMATPEDLKKYPDTIGKIINGVKYKIISDDGSNVNKGILHIHCKWMMHQTDPWISTGDVMIKNEEDYLFIQGRKDSMIVSGGENVFPEEVEKICLQHPHIEDIKVVAEPDNLYGHRLIAFIVLNYDDTNIVEWMKKILARFQMPKAIYLVERLPYFENGKLNKEWLLINEEYRKNNLFDLCQ